MTTPLRSLLLLGYVAILAGLVMLASPGEKQVSEELDLKVFTWDDAFGQPQKKVDMSGILSVKARVDSLEVVEKGAITKTETENANLGTPDRVSIEYRPGDVPIELPSSTPEALHPFFQSLENIEQKRSAGLVRVVHYGDSQLEGDQITDHLRNRLQEQFGGCGVGIIPVSEVVQRSSMLAESGKNWGKYVIYGSDRKLAEHSFYSLLGSHFFIKGDSADGRYGAWLKYGKSKYAYKRNNLVEEAKLLLRVPDQPVQVEYSFNHQSGGEETIYPLDGFQIKTIPFFGEFESAEFQFSGKGKPEIYGVAFDCKQGIAVDNVAMRGSSGTEFVAMNRGHLREQMKSLNVKLIILQFGVNVVPNVITDYSYYETALFRQIQYLKSVSEDASILVISVSDMAMKKGPNYVTYPNISLVRAAQKGAAFKAGAAYWDLFLAMGGENSMVSWVNADPPLAAKDFTHFSRRGARLVAEMLYNELMNEYVKFKQDYEGSAEQ